MVAFRGILLGAPVMAGKYGDHTPRTRLVDIYAHSGATIAVSTMAEWVAAVAEAVAPIVGVFAQRVQRAHVIETDEIHDSQNCDAHVSVPQVRELVNLLNLVQFM